MKRGESGLSFVVGVDKPCGMTSHDVVNRCRRIFGEKRVGHTGTLDPLASGAMAVCVGPATKLSSYITFHDKAYLARIAFGTATDTDDAEGEAIRTLPVPEGLADPSCARAALAGMIGRQSQLPPVYSAVKVDGVRSYAAARKGTVIDLEPREVEVRGAELAGIVRDEDGTLCWDVRFEVSAGTYIRSLARDLGTRLGTCAHLAALRRLASGRLHVGSCATLAQLEADPAAGRLDPIRLLGIRYAAVSGPRQEKAARNGAPLPADGLRLLEAIDVDGDHCSSGARLSADPLADGESVGLVLDNKLVAIYVYNESLRALKARCGFVQGVSRGTV